MFADSLTLPNGWLVFLLLVAGVGAAPAAASALLRRWLPPRSRPDARLQTPIEPVAFGLSPRVRRAPRHAVSPHRALVTSVLGIGLGLVLVPFAAAGRSVGLDGLLVAFLFAAPTLLVALHARRRGDS